MNEIDFSKLEALREEAVENMLIAEASRTFESGSTVFERREAALDEAYWRGRRDTLDKGKELLR